MLHRLTASIFGRVVKRRPYTTCHSIVKSCLQNNTVLTDAMEYGIAKERVAIALFMKKFEKKNGETVDVEESGLWIDPHSDFLGASPDGLVKKADAIVEVKCLYSASKVDVKSIDDAIALKKAPFLQKVDNKVSLKRSDNYYYQIQGQLNIARKSKCYFIVYVSDSVEVFYEEIERDESFWRMTMLPKLTQFFKECIAPEVIRNNLGKNMKCKDPPFIEDAINAREQSRKM